MPKSVKTLGLITAPGYPDKLGKVLKKELPALLQYYVDDSYNWQIDYIIRSLTGATENSQEVIEATLEERKENDWDFSIALTDLPLLTSKEIILAEAYRDGYVGLISLPGLGSTPMIKRVKESIVQLVNEMYYGSSEKDRKVAEHRIQEKREIARPKIKNKSSTNLVGKRGFELLSPIKRNTPSSEETNIDVQFTVSSKFNGILRLLTGMVRANRPWAMFPAFMKVVVIAFTTGAYALVFPTLWKISNDYSITRMALLSIVSILAMVGWIILAHNLWEKRKDRSNRLRKLYNMVTFFTLLISVCLFYGLLFLIFSVAVLLFIPIESLKDQLDGNINFIQYFYIAWTVTSISTIIGALGSALENEEVVLSSTYGYRQRQRYEKIKDAKEEKEEAQQEKKEAAEEKEEAAIEKQKAQKKK